MNFEDFKMLGKYEPHGSGFPVEFSLFLTNARPKSYGDQQTFFIETKII